MLLPVLKPNDWAGPDAGAQAHVWIGTPAEPEVLVAYAQVDTDTGQVEYLTSPTSVVDDEIVREAFSNLEYYHTDFEVVEADGGRMLVSAGWPFAAERVLCQSHMLRAHEKLDAAEILVSITRRGMVLACDVEGGDEVRQTLNKLHVESWANPATADQRVYDQLILVADGALAGTLPVGS